ncbi:MULTISPECIES: cytochrome c6 PetJ [unclassified Leptolyngbya]|uniref:cytochrome c6 PetJ n=1 Tax=unclassified Leptolyngbya TaxID=2650499 RepID=UPI003D323D62
MMKTIQRMRTLLGSIALSVLFLSGINPSALAADTAAGAKVFNANCAACHAGGGNVINGAKTLKKDALVANGKDTVEAIVTQVTNGKGAMPSFKGRLNEDQIQSVAMYVLDKSEAGW